MNFYPSNFVFLLYEDEGEDAGLIEVFDTLDDAIVYVAAMYSVASDEWESTEDDDGLVWLSPGEQFLIEQRAVLGR